MPLPTIPSGNVASATAATGYTVDNSCRFSGSDDRLVRDATGTSTESNNKWTFSCWVKRGKLGAEQMLVDHRSSGSAQFNIRFMSDDSLQAYDVVGGSVLMQKDTTAKYRDPSAWMHILWSSDRSISSPTTKLWVNGTEVTSWATDNEYSQDDTGTANSDAPTWIGEENSSGSNFEGYLAEMVWLDGTFVSNATDFGEFDEDSPTIWKPKDVSGLTFGTNGWYLDFKDSANLGNDANGGTDFGETGIAAADQALDSPTNNFATWNSLYMPTDTAVTFSEGNCKVVSQNASGKYWGAASTIGITAGKWYAEFEATSADNKPVFGIVGNPNKKAKDGDWIGEEADGYGYVADGGKYNNNTENASWGSTFTAGDVISVAVDITNLKIYFAKNGTWQDSGDPTSGSTGTGAAFTILTPTSSSVHDKAYFFACSDQSTGGDTMSANFGGCPAFTISSGNADANGYGNFEYAPPSGYLALCTKNLGSDGG